MMTTTTLSGFFSSSSASIFAQSEQSDWTRSIFHVPCCKTSEFPVLANRENSGNSLPIHFSGARCIIRLLSNLSCSVPSVSCVRDFNESIAKSASPASTSQATKTASTFLRSSGGDFQPNRPLNISKQPTITKSKLIVIHGLIVIVPKQPQDTSPLNPFIMETSAKTKKQRSDKSHVQCCQIPAIRTRAKKISPTTTAIKKYRSLNISSRGVKTLPCITGGSGAVAS